VEILVVGGERGLDGLASLDHAVAVGVHQGLGDALVHGDVGLKAGGYVDAFGL